MSWFDAAGFATLAKSALNSAQKTLDKALDIREEHIENANPSSSRSDDDRFFESFGLGPKTPITEEKISVPTPPKAKPSQIGPQNSGFWTDTWESFFDTKAPAPEPQVTSNKSDSKSATSSPKKPTFVKQDQPTVSCQPQRASLFPGDVKPTDGQSSSHESSKQCQEPDTESSGSPIVVASEAPITHPPISLDTSINRIEKVSSPDSAMEFKDSETPNVPLWKDDDVKSPEKGDVIDGNLGDGQTIVEDEHEDKSEDVSLQDSSPDTETPSHCSQPEVKMSDSYVNIEDSILSKSAFKKVSSSESSPTKQQSSDKNSDDVHGSSEVHVNKPSNIPSEFSDSFQVLNDSILQHESMWVMDDNSSVHQPNRKVSSKGNDSSSSSSKDECEIDIKDCEEKSSGSSHSRELTHSFVKCSLDDVEDSSHRGQSPLSTTTSERSDMTKLESEQNTSGDENETTTSSDIEVLSPPNGENGERNLSPLKHIWIPRTIRLRRSQSPSTDCSSIVTSINEDKDFNIKDFEGLDLDKMFQQQEDLQMLLEAREKRIMELSTENLKLLESEEKLQIQVRELKLSNVRELQNTSNLTKDLAQRLALTEERTQKATKERDLFKKQLDTVNSEMAQRVSLTHMEEIVKEKDQQIKELLEEGEKLSKKELQHTTIIKKLRVKEEEMERNFKSTKEKLEENTKEVERLRKSLGAKDEQEKKHIEAIRHLTSTTSKQEKELSLLQSNLEDSVEKEAGTKKSLDCTFQELTELKKQFVIKDKEISDHANREANREKELLLVQIEDLRNTLKRYEDSANNREKSLKEDIFRLQAASQEAEARNEELTKNISTSSRPLVRQIETLQASYNSQMSSWEKVEKNLTDKLRDVQNQLVVITAKEKLVTEKFQEAQLKLTRLESDNSSLRQEKIQLSSELQVLNSKCEILEENTNRNTLSADSLKQNFASELNKLKDEKDRISKELENCIQLLKEERALNQNLQQDLHSKDVKNENISPNASPRSSLRSSVESINNWAQDDNYEKKIPSQLNKYRLSVYDSLSKTGCTTSILENLQSQLKQREGEISQLQSEITKLEQERESVSQEWVQVISQNEQLQEKLDKLGDVEKLHKDLSQKYRALLQMYNEKVEEYEAMLLDLADVKSAYRRQIEELLQK